jgi:two-component system phosphate regulon sensor histidine kinase PhoR
MWPKKLIWQLYFSYLLIMGVPVLIVTWYSSQAFRAFYLQRNVEDLKTRAVLIGSQVEEHFALRSSGSIDSLCKVISRSVNTRFTVIAPSGKVIGDSERNPDSMENHGTRPEVIAALAGKTGVSDRFSQTLMENMMYVAIPVYNAGVLCAVVRTALPTLAVRAALNRLYLNIIWAVLFIEFFFVFFYIDGRYKTSNAASSKPARRNIKSPEEIVKQIIHLLLQRIEGMIIICSYFPDYIRQ